MQLDSGEGLQASHSQLFQTVRLRTTAVIAYAFAPHLRDFRATAIPFDMLYSHTLDGHKVLERVVQRRSGRQPLLRPRQSLAINCVDSLSL